MAKSPSVSGRDIIKALKKIGFVVARVKGSHNFLQHPDGRCTTVPVHNKEIIGPGLLHKIISDCDLTLREFIKLL